MPVKKGPVKRKAIRSSLGGPPIKSRKSRLSIVNQEFHRPKEPGVVLTFGQGDVGQLGLGTDILERNRPALVPNLENVVDVCAGGMHTVCLTATGEVVTFGCNDEGALGRDTSREGSETEPEKVILEGQVVQVTAGDSHSAALLEDGRVFAWGAFRDSSGTMGLISNGVIETKPVEILPGIKVVKIASGADHLVMLGDDGQLHTCGCGEQGQLGRVSERGASRGSRQGMAQLLAPSLVSFKPRKKPEFEDIWAGTYCTYAKDSLGQIHVFGLNNFNQLGIQDPRCHFHPIISEGFAGNNWGEICGGPHHSLALDSNGVIYAMGRKEYGRLGLGEDSDDAQRPTVIPTLKDSKCIDVACGTVVSFAVTSTGEVYGWGMGDNGQLGTGNDSDVYEPLQIKGRQLESYVVMQVSAGGQHTALLAKSK